MIHFLYEYPCRTKAKKEWGVAMKVTLTPVTRKNWLLALELRTHEEQIGCVPSIAVSL